MTGADPREIDTYLGLMAQRGIEVIGRREIHDVGALAITSTAPVGEGRVFVELVQEKDPWAKRPWPRVPYCRITYSGDGDWLRLARSSGLDGLMWAIRPEVAVVEVRTGDMFGDVSVISDTVYVRVEPSDEDVPILERIHEIEVAVGDSFFPAMYVTPPFGIKDLERRVAQVLEYAPLESIRGNFVCQECGSTDTGKSRLSVLSSLKTGLCLKCLGTALELGGPSLPIEPKGWRK